MNDYYERLLLHVRLVRKTTFYSISGNYVNCDLLFLYSRTHCERFPLASACNKAETLRFNGHPGTLDMLFDIPDGR